MGEIDYEDLDPKMRYYARMAKSRIVRRGKIEKSEKRKIKDEKLSGTKLFKGWSSFTKIRCKFLICAHEWHLESNCLIQSDLIFIIRDQEGPDRSTT